MCKVFFESLLPYISLFVKSQELSQFKQQRKMVSHQSVQTDNIFNPRVGVTYGHKFTQFQEIKTNLIGLAGDAR